MIGAASSSASLPAAAARLRGCAQTTTTAPLHPLSLVARSLTDCRCLDRAVCLWSRAPRMSRPKGPAESDGQRREGETIGPESLCDRSFRIAPLLFDQ